MFDISNQKKIKKEYETNQKDCKLKGAKMAKRRKKLLKEN